MLNKTHTRSIRFFKWAWLFMVVWCNQTFAQNDAKDHATSSTVETQFKLNINDTLVQSATDLNKMLQFFKEVKAYQNKTGDFEYDAEVYLSYASSGLRWALQYGSEMDVLESKFYKLRYSYDDGKYDQGFLLAYELLTSELFQEDKRITRVTSYIKNMYLKTDAYDKLLEFFPTYDRLNRKHGRTISKSDYINDFYLARAYYGQKNYTKAILFFKKYVRLIEKTGEGPIHSVYNDIGLCFKAINQWDSANYYFNLGLNSLEGEQQHSPNAYLNYLEHIIRSNKADYFVFKGEHSKAIPFYHKELILSRERGDYPILSSAYYNMANIHYLDNDFALALGQIDSAIITGFARKEFLAETYQLKAKILATNGKKDKAEVYFKMAQRLNDSIELNKVSNSYIIASTQYDLARKESDLALSEKRVGEAKNRNRLALFGLGALALLALLLFMFYRKSQADKSIIANQKSAAVKDAQEKSLLLKEVHHRVKNNLQVISGLLDLQQSKNKDKDFTGLVEDTQKYIHSMSLVHEMLYQKDQVSRINIQEYLTKLSSFAASTQLKKNIKVKVDAQNIELSLDKATPLGLVLTELISNSFKHGFSEDLEADAKINISVESVGKKCFFKYQDDGIGLPSDFSIQQTRSLGFRLIRMFAEEMNADLHIGEGDGFSLSLDFTNQDSLSHA